MQHSGKSNKREISSIIATKQIQRSKTHLILSRETFDKYITEGALPPRLKGKLKDHKDGKPLREIADASKSPAHKLAKAVNKLFKPYTRLTKQQ